MSPQPLCFVHGTPYCLRTEQWGVSGGGGSCQIVETAPNPDMPRSSGRYCHHQSPLQLPGPLWRPLAGAFPCAPSPHPRRAQNGRAPFVYRRPWRAPATPHVLAKFAVPNQGCGVNRSADGPRLFQFRVCPRRSSFFMLFCPQLTSAALASRT
jgi:hypothetical protein